MASIKGYFPSAEPAKVLNRVTKYKRVNSKYVLEQTWTSGSDFAFASTIDGYFNNNFNSTSSPIDFSAYGCKMTGTPTPTPPDKLFSSKVVLTNNKKFTERQRKGEIVVSNYQRIQCLATYSNGGTPVKTGKTSPKNFNWKSTTSRGWAPVGGNMLDTFYLGNNEIGMYGSFQKLYEEATFSDELNPYQVGWDDSWIEPFLNQLNVDEDIKNRLIMDSLGSANSETVDILTALAELPETVIMCINACKQVLKLFKDARNKELRLLDSAKKTRYELVEKINRINYSSKQEYLKARNNRTKQIIERKRQADVKTARATAKKFLNDITTAIASVWLTFRYGIMPNVYLIEGLSKSIDDLNVLYRRYSEFERVDIDTPDFPGWTRSGTVLVEARAFIKRRYEQLTDWKRILTSFSANIFVTAWELIPLSFVIDWFINVGTVLSNGFGGNLNGYKEAASFSHKILTSNVTYVHNDTGCSVTLNFKGYKRFVINPRSYNCLQWNPDLDLYRRLDAAALSWNLVLKNFFK